MIDNLDLLFHHRHAPGEVVVLAHLARQLVNLAVRHGLRGRELLLDLFVALHVGKHHPDEREPARDGRRRCV